MIQRTNSLKLPAMKRALDEPNRRRARQVKFNEENGIIRFSIHREIHDLTEEVSLKALLRQKVSTA